MAQVNTYLTFNGTCEAAFDFYKSVFGGEFVTKMKFGDAPGQPADSADADKIMHVSLPISSETILMASDTNAHMGPVTAGNNFAISVATDSEAEADKIFNGLSAGGTVTMPLDKTFWGAYFGMFTDKFGIHWMVNYDYPKN